MKTTHNFGSTCLGCGGGVEPDQQFEITQRLVVPVCPRCVRQLEKMPLQVAEAIREVLR